MDKIVRSVGTPVYIYSRKEFLNRFQQLKNAFKSVDVLICFSVKANSNLTVLRNLTLEGCGMDIVSGGELYRAMHAGCAPKMIVYSGVGKNEEEIANAIRAGILMFNIESIPELEKIKKIARRMNKKVHASLRVNPDVDAKTHRYITTGKKENKFGIDIKSAEKIYIKHKKSDFLQLTGVHAHIGSQIVKADPFVKAANKLSVFIKNLRKNGVKIDTLNLGGGLGIVYQNERPLTAVAYARKIAPVIRQLGVRLVLEPGRFIAGNSGVFVTKVIYVKKTGRKNFVIVDGAMNDLIRPSLYDAYHGIVSYKKSSSSITADIVGPICESGDFFAKGRKISNVLEGDILICKSAGAYGFTMSSNYNSRPRVAEVMVDDNEFHVVRKRETYEDLIKAEL